jgi:TolA-binding protein
MRSDKIALLLVLVIGMGSFGSLGCRTAQQQSRRGQTASAANGNGRGGTLSPASRDSLLLIEEKLTEVIDSLASLVATDHQRLRSLEQEVQMLRSRMGIPPSDPPASYIPPPPAYTPPPPAYTPPPPAYTPPQNYAPQQNYAPPQQNYTPQQQNYTPPQNTTPPQSNNSSPQYYNSLQNYTPPQNNNSSAPNAAPPASVMAPPTNDAALQDRYSTAMRLYNENEFNSALKAFHDLEQDDPHGPFTSNYIYWQGESDYALKRYGDALQEFGTVVEQYPTSGKAPAARFKLGETYEKMGLKTSARDAYERLLADYPSSEFTDRARARIKKL